MKAEEEVAPSPNTVAPSPGPARPAPSRLGVMEAIGDEGLTVDEALRRSEAKGVTLLVSAGAADKSDALAQTPEQFRAMTQVAAMLAPDHAASNEGERSYAIGEHGNVYNRITGKPVFVVAERSGERGGSQRADLPVAMLPDTTAPVKPPRSEPRRVDPEEQRRASRELLEAELRQAAEEVRQDLADPPYVRVRRELKEWIAERPQIYGEHAASLATSDLKRAVGSKSWTVDAGFWSGGLVAFPVGVMAAAAGGLVYPEGIPGDVLDLNLEACRNVGVLADPEASTEQKVLALAQIEQALVGDVLLGRGGLKAKRAVAEMATESPRVKGSLFGATDSPKTYPAEVSPVPTPPADLRVFTQAIHHLLVQEGRLHHMHRQDVLNLGNWGRRANLSLPGSALSPEDFAHAKALDLELRKLFDVPEQALPAARKIATELLREFAQTHGAPSGTLGPAKPAAAAPPEIADSAPEAKPEVRDTLAGATDHDSLLAALDPRAVAELLPEQLARLERSLAEKSAILGDAELARARAFIGRVLRYHRLLPETPWRATELARADAEAMRQLPANEAGGAPTYASEPAEGLEPILELGEKNPPEWKVDPAKRPTVLAPEITWLLKDSVVRESLSKQELAAIQGWRLADEHHTLSPAELATANELGTKLGRLFESLGLRDYVDGQREAIGLVKGFVERHGWPSSLDARYPGWD